MKNNLKNLLIKSKLIALGGQYKICKLEEIDRVTKNSIIMIDHSYGSPLSNEKFLSKKITFFLNNNIKILTL